MEAKDLSGLPSSPEEARRLGLKQYYTGVPCVRGHLAKRYLHYKHNTGACSVCSVENKRKYVSAHRETVKAKNKEYRQRDYVKEAQKLRYDSWRKLYPEKVKTATSNWRKNNLHKKAQTERLRKSKRREAKPSWVDEAALALIYQQADWLTRLLGVPYHVDHIVPLVNKNVCGLHVPWNLRIVEATENFKKGNSLLEDLISG